jgi:RimJ/RimL family protein N-acetyltransferase
MEPIFLELPERIESERLIIAWPRPGDGATVNEANRETFAELERWMPWARTLPTAEESEEHARRSHANVLTRTDLGLYLFRKDTGTLVGCSGFHPRDWDVPKFEIGYWCRTSCQGRGYITEAVRAITGFGFSVMKARRIEIRCDERNERSRRVAERAGYPLEARLAHDCVAPDGVLRTTLVHALTR